MSGPTARIEALADRLAAVAADLDELSFDVLQEAAAHGATTRPAIDKPLMRARRAVEKAADVLRSITSAD